MELIRTDIVSIFDVRFENREQLLELYSKLSQEPKAGSRILTRLKTSFSWVFYGNQPREYESFDITSRISRPVAGAVLRLNRRSRVGTYVVWRVYRGESDPHQLKKRAWAECGQDLDALRALCDKLHTERYYPFVALEAQTEDIDAFANANAEEIGRILTGDLEGERPAVLRTYVDRDLSLRSYEKLLMRWTEAFALYSRTESEEFYENCVFRAVQIFEHCILARASLFALGEEIEHLSQHLTVVTPAKWTKARDLLARFSVIEETLVTYPPVQSVEADRLVSAAHSSFGIEKVLAGTKAKVSELREQLEWAKTQTLGLLALATYLFDKVIGWDNLRNLAVNALHQLRR